MNIYLLSIGVGAIIGLFTNWIAIVMLFRPHREYRLFGRRLPLTPGLIPRRQQELADKLGEVVQEDLLTPEGIATSLQRPKVAYAVQKAATAALARTLAEAPTVGALARKWLGDGGTERLEAALVAKTVAYLRTEDGRAKLGQLADSLFDHLRGALSEDGLQQVLTKGVAGALQERLTAGGLTWQDALPTGARTLVEERLQAQVRPLLEGAARFLEEPNVVVAISTMLQEKVENIPLIGPMAKGFLTPERVAADIVPRIQNVVVSGTTEQLLRDKLHEQVQGFWQHPIGRYLGQLSQQELSEVVGGLLRHVLTRALAEGSGTKEQFRTLLVEGVAAGANERTVADLLRRLLGAVEAIDLRVLHDRHAEKVERLVAGAWAFLRDRLIASMPELLEAVAIRDVVRDQVASYPIPTLERLILSVVNRELRLITILGGVLGAIIGFFQALLAQLAA